MSPQEVCLPPPDIPSVSPDTPGNPGLPGRIALKNIIIIHFIYTQKSKLQAVFSSVHIVKIL